MNTNTRIRLVQKIGGGVELRIPNEIATELGLDGLRHEFLARGFTPDQLSPAIPGHRYWTIPVTGPDE